MSLDVTNLSIEIAGRRVVDDLSFSVGDGDRLGLIGESGSGKSLTLLALLGLLPDEATASGSAVLSGGAGAAEGAGSAAGAGGAGAAESAGSAAGPGGAGAAARAGGAAREGGARAAARSGGAGDPRTDTAAGGAADPVELVGLSERALARIRGSQIGMVFQDPSTALNPLQTIGRQLAEPFRLHEKIGKRDARLRAIDSAREVGLPDPEHVVDRYPHQLSGGQRQRVGIGIAIGRRPSLLLADEPTTALDVTTQKEVLDLFRRLTDRHGMSLIFVTHDLAVLAQVTDDVVVLSQGRAIERGTVPEILHTPQHAVTRGLVEAARATTWSAS